MSKKAAHELLDAVRMGMLVPAHLITEALRATGDLQGHHRPQKADHDDGIDWPTLEAA